MKYITTITVFILITAMFSCEKCKEPIPEPRDSIIKGEWIDLSENIDDEINCFYTEPYPEILFIGGDKHIYTYDGEEFQKIPNISGKTHDITKLNSKYKYYFAMSDVTYNQNTYDYALVEYNDYDFTQVSNIFPADNYILSVNEISGSIFIGGLFDSIADIYSPHFAVYRISMWETEDLSIINIREILSCFNRLFIAEQYPTNKYAYIKNYEWKIVENNTDEIIDIESDNSRMLFITNNGIKYWYQYTLADYENSPPADIDFQKILIYNDSLYFFPKYSEDTMIHVWNEKEWKYIVANPDISNDNSINDIIFFKNDLFIANNKQPKLMKFNFVLAP